MHKELSFVPLTLLPCKASANLEGEEGRTLVEVIIALVLVGLEGAVFGKGRMVLVELCLAELLLDMPSVLVAVTVFCSICAGS